MNKPMTMTVAMLLSCDSFESFFGHVLQLSVEDYVRAYRNDWSWYYAKGLLDNDVRAIIYIPSTRHEGVYETEVGVTIRFLRLAAWYRPLAMFRRAMRITRWSLYFQERINSAALMRPLERAIAADEADALYVQEYWGGRFDHLAHRVNVPLFAVDQGGVAHCVVKWFKRSSFKKAAMLYSQTADECSQVRSYGGYTTLQPNGGDVSFFVPPVDGTQRSKTIVTVARLTDKQKRTSDLIRAISLLPAEWTLDIVGTGPDRETLELLASKLGVTSRVTFHGFRSREEVRSHIQQCGVYAMPSANEAMCLALLEAMSCGAAVVASRIRTFESLITDGVNGRLFPVGDVRALANAIEDAWHARVDMGHAAAASVVNHFDSKKLYAQLVRSLRTHVAQSAALSKGTLSAAGEI